MQTYLMHGSWRCGECGSTMSIDDKQKTIRCTHHGCDEHNVRYFIPSHTLKPLEKPVKAPPRKDKTLDELLKEKARERAKQRS